MIPTLPLQSSVEGPLILVGMGLLLLAGLGVLGAIAYLEHRKEMRLVESGQYEPRSAQPGSWLLAAGLVLVAVGLADLVRAVWTGTVPGDGLTLFGLGLAALAYYWLRQRERRPGE